MCINVSFISRCYCFIIGVRRVDAIDSTICLGHGATIVTSGSRHHDRYVVCIFFSRIKDCLTTLFCYSFLFSTM